MVVAVAGSRSTCWPGVLVGAGGGILGARAAAALLAGELWGAVLGWGGGCCATSGYGTEHWSLALLHGPSGTAAVPVAAAWLLSASLLKPATAIW